jgi:hypothetical protein
MTKEEFNSLQEGDIVRHEDSSSAVMVTGNYGGRVTAVRTYDLTHPPEWKLIFKANHTLHVQDCTREKDHDGPCNGWPCVVCYYCGEVKGAHMKAGYCNNGSGTWFLAKYRGSGITHNPEWQQP